MRTCGYATGTPDLEELTSYPNRCAIEEKMIRQSVRNMVVAPLHYQDELIGTLDLASPNPGNLNPMNIIKLREVLPLFSMAMKRSLDELDNNIQAIIKEKCTALHPLVEWRFGKSAINFVEKQRSGIHHSEIEPTVFEGVYPLYGGF